MRASYVRSIQGIIVYKTDYDSFVVPQKWIANINIKKEGLIQNFVEIHIWY